MKKSARKIKKNEQKVAPQEFCFIRLRIIPQQVFQVKNRTAQGLRKRPLQHFPKREIRREGRLRGLRFAMKKVSEKQGIVETRAFRFFTTEVTKKHEVLESQITQIPRILVGLEVFSTNLAF